TATRTKQGEELPLAYPQSYPPHSLYVTEAFCHVDDLQDKIVHAEASTETVSLTSAGLGIDFLPSDPCFKNLHVSQPARIYRQRVTVDDHQVGHLAGFQTPLLGFFSQGVGRTKGVHCQGLLGCK